MPVIDQVIVGDIKCGGCVRVAQRALEQVAVIEAVSANFRKQTCSFEFMRPVEAAVIDQALEAVGHATVSAAATAAAPETFTALVRGCRRQERPPLPVRLWLRRVRVLGQAGLAGRRGCRVDAGGPLRPLAHDGLRGRQSLHGR